MAKLIDPVDVSAPRQVPANIVKLTDDLSDRMHQLLERNTDGNLAPSELHELEALTRIAELSEIVAMEMWKSR